MTRAVWRRGRKVNGGSLNIRMVALAFRDRHAMIPEP